MRVAIVNRHRQDILGGSEIQCDLVARGLIERGHEAVYIAVNGSGPYGSVPYKVVPVEGECQPIVKACLAQKPTIIYWRLGKMCFRCVAKRMKGADVPFVFAVSCISDTTWLPPWQRLKSCSSVYGACKQAVRTAWNHQGFKLVSGVTSLNPDYLGRIDSPREIFIPNGMSAARRSFSWPRPYVAWVANIKAHKRPEACVALAQAVALHKVDVLMIGQIQQEEYRWLQDPHLLPGNMHYLGPKTVEEVNGVLSGALALVHTCIPEGFGNNFIQAWLQGTPTISLEFDPGGLIEKHELGYVSHGDEIRFHQDVLKIVDNPCLAERMGANARAWAQLRCRPKRNVGRLISFFQDILEDNVHPGAPAG